VWGLEKLLWQVKEVLDGVGEILPDARSEACSMRMRRGIIL